MALGQDRMRGGQIDMLDHFQPSSILSWTDAETHATWTASPISPSHLPGGCAFPLTHTLDV
jgi:hypothetical protein